MVNITTKLYILKCWILCRVNYISIFKKKLIANIISAKFWIFSLSEHSLRTLRRRNQGSKILANLPKFAQLPTGRPRSVCFPTMHILCVVLLLKSVPFLGFSSLIYKVKVLKWIISKLLSCSNCDCWIPGKSSGVGEQASPVSSIKQKPRKTENSPFTSKS